MRPKNEERKMQVYDFISAGIEQNGVCPTTDEIANGLGMAKSTVSKYFNRLADEGLIERRGRYRTVTAEGGGYSRMPILGTVACGEPILAIEEVQGYLPIDKQTLGHGEYFGLVAQGDSMIGVGVCDGDVVYVRRQTTAEDGEIVVAMVEDGETGSWSATLKRFFRDEERGVYILHPENPSLEDIVLDEVFIVGVAVKVLKSL